MVPKGFVAGFVHFWAGHLQEAYATLDSVRWMLEVEAQENAGEAEGRYLVGLVYAAMGWKRRGQSRNRPLLQKAGH